MKTQITPESVLQNLAQIQRLDRGSVSVNAIRPAPTEIQEPQGASRLL